MFSVLKIISKNVLETITTFHNIYNLVKAIPCKMVSIK